ncbi:hypothetical protein CsSME_00021739 [Camellia sinensis var. sinensis]
MVLYPTHIPYPCPSVGCPTRVCVKASLLVSGISSTLAAVVENGCAKRTTFDQSKRKSSCSVSGLKRREGRKKMKLHTDKKGNGNEAEILTATYIAVVFGGHHH